MYFYLTNYREKKREKHNFGNRYRVLQRAEHNKQKKKRDLGIKCVIKHTYINT